MSPLTLSARVDTPTTHLSPSEAPTAAATPDFLLILRRPDHFVFAWPYFISRRLGADAAGFFRVAAIVIHNERSKLEPKMDYVDGCGGGLAGGESNAHKSGFD